jgi:hypothetical protein
VSLALATLLLSSPAAEVRMPGMYTGGDWQNVHGTSWLRIMRCVHVLLNYNNLTMHRLVRFRFA